MDNKRTLLGMIVALALFGAWYGVQYVIDKQHPEWAEQAAKRRQLEESTSSQAQPSSSTPETQPATQTTTAPTAATGLHVVENLANVVNANLGSAAAKDPTWSMQLELSAVGAGVRQVTLNQFQKAVKDASRYSFQTAYADHPGTEPLGTRFIEINGSRLDLSTVSWSLQGTPTESSATYSLVVALPEDKETLRLTKTYTLPKREAPSAGYEVAVNYTIENLSGRDLKISTGFNGPTVPPKEVERGTDRQIVAGYNEGSSIRVVQHASEEFHKDKISQDLSQDKKQPAVWVGAGSVYFDGIVLPVAPVSGDAITQYTINSTALDPDNQDLNDIQTRFDTSSISLVAGKTVSLPLNVYFGPKMRAVFETGYYSAFPRMYDKILIVGSSYCAFCTFPWLVAVLVKLLSIFHSVLFHDWGLAIIALVCLVRLILHPVTKKSQVYMMRMGKMGPEMERLKKKYADDKDALNKAMMQFYKEQGMAPVLGCLPMFLQMPIWIALWTALQSTFELRLSPFLWFGRLHLTWIADLARPDALIPFPHVVTIPLVGFQFDSFNLLPILMAGVMYLQQKYQPRPVAATPEQEQQQKMMTWMSTLLFPLFLYKGPAGLNLYIFASTGAGIIESKIIREHIKQREEAEKAGRVFVETKPTRAVRKGGNEPTGPKKPPGKLAGWLADLQAKAEQLKREQGKGK